MENAVIKTDKIRKKIIAESELKLDDEQYNFLVYGATDEQFNEMIEYLKEKQS